MVFADTPSVPLKDFPAKNSRRVKVLNIPAFPLIQLMLPHLHEKTVPLIALSFLILLYSTFLSCPIPFLLCQVPHPSPSLETTL